MRAIIHHSYGGPEVLELAELPEPRVHVDSVLVRVKAAAVNPADLGLRAGAAAATVDAWFPVIPGWDVAGVVEHAGIGAPEFSPGDEVIGYLRGEIQRQHGGYAELVAADVRTLARKPPRLSWEQAAALPLAGLTAYRAVVHALGVSAGETLVVHGAGGGVGSLAVQVARAHDVEVIATAAPRDHDYLRELGATPVEYGTGVEQRIRAIAPAGVDAVLDTVGRDVLASTPAIGRPGVRTASIVQFDRPDTVPVFARLDRDDLHAVVHLAERGALVPRVGATFPLGEAADAHRALVAGNIAGKVVLRIA
jgi:NADPH:quinone reductase-like Zn-dependent oxidoreductase